MGILSKFLSRNSIVGGGSLPLIHSTAAHHIRYIRESDRIFATSCNVFTQDKLNYFFVGRPAYKYEAGEETAQYWELPCCFLFDFNSFGSPKRAFPFDSGAFNGKKYPRYINRLRQDEFEFSKVKDGVSKMIGAYFGDVRSYFKFQSKGKIGFEKEFSLGVFDAEIRALHKLSFDDTSEKFDDRRLTIEMQYESDVNLSVNKPLAVIAPLEYFADADFRDHVENKWNAQPIDYRVHSLSVKAYYSEIYTKVENYLEQKGYL